MTNKKILSAQTDFVDMSDESVHNDNELDYLEQDEVERYQLSNSRQPYIVLTKDFIAPSELYEQFKTGAVVDLTLVLVGPTKTVSKKVHKQLFRIISSVFYGLPNEDVVEINFGTDMEVEEIINLIDMIYSPQQRFKITSADWRKVVFLLHLANRFDINLINVKKFGADRNKLILFLSHYAVSDKSLKQICSCLDNILAPFDYFSDDLLAKMVSYSFFPMIIGNFGYVDYLEEAFRRKLKFKIRWSSARDIDNIIIWLCLGNLERLKDLDSWLCFKHNEDLRAFVDKICRNKKSDLTNYIYKVYKPKGAKLWSDFFNWDDFVKYKEDKIAQAENKILTEFFAEGEDVFISALSNEGEIFSGKVEKRQEKKETYWHIDKFYVDKIEDYEKLTSLFKKRITFIKGLISKKRYKNLRKALNL